MLDTPHLFYQWPRSRQNRFLIGCGVGFICLMLAGLIGVLLGYGVFLLLLPVTFIFAQALDTPFGQRAGRLIYFSPLFIVEKRSESEFVLHGGTIFDYFFVFSWADRGEPARQRVVREFLVGLSAFATYLEEAGLDDALIIGTSYFFSPRTAERFGFKVENQGSGTRLILSFNGLVVFLMYSFIRGRFAFPPLNKVRSVTTSARNLIQQRRSIDRLLNRISRKA